MSVDDQVLDAHAKLLVVLLCGEAVIDVVLLLVVVVVLVLLAVLLVDDRDELLELDVVEMALEIVDRCTVSSDKDYIYRKKL